LLSFSREGKKEKGLTSGKGATVQEREGEPLKKVILPGKPRFCSGYKGGVHFPEGGEKENPCNLFFSLPRRRRARMGGGKGKKSNMPMEIATKKALHCRAVKDRSNA